MNELSKDNSIYLYSRIYLLSLNPPDSELTLVCSTCVKQNYYILYAKK